MKCELTARSDITVGGPHVPGIHDTTYLCICFCSGNLATANTGNFMAFHPSVYIKQQSKKNMQPGSVNAGGGQVYVYLPSGSTFGCRSCSRWRGGSVSKASSLLAASSTASMMSASSTLSLVRAGTHCFASTVARERIMGRHFESIFMISAML